MQSLVSNPRQPQLHPLEVIALADTGALMLCIPEHVVVQLQLEQESLREVTVADGRVMQVPYVGPVRVAYQGRSCFVGASDPSIPPASAWSPIPAAPTFAMLW